MQSVACFNVVSIDAYRNPYREARLQADLTREKAAVRLFVGERTLANYELGHTEPPPEVVNLMAKVYKAPELVKMHCKKCALGGYYDDGGAAALAA